MNEQSTQCVQRKAMELALEALKDLQLSTDDYYESSHEASKKGDKAITALKEALAQPSVSVETPIDFELAYGEIYKNQRAALAKSLAQPEQEPVAEIHSSTLRWIALEDNRPTNALLYTTPYVATPRPQRTAAEGEDTRRAWVGLTLNEMDDLNATSDVGTYNHIKAIEAKLKAKNERKEKNT